MISILYLAELNSTQLNSTQLRISISNKDGFAKKILIDIIQ